MTNIILLVFSIFFFEANAQAKKCDKDTPEVCMEYFNVALDKRKTEDAKKWLGEACKFNIARGCLKLGSYHEKIESFATARTFYQKACDLDKVERCANVERLREK